PISRHLQGVEHVGLVHGAAAVDDGVQAASVASVAARLLHQPLDHGGGGEQRQRAACFGGVENLGRVEAAAGGHDVARGAAHVHEVVQPGARSEERRVGKVCSARGSE